MKRELIEYHITCINGAMAIIDAYDAYFNDDNDLVLECGNGQTVEIINVNTYGFYVNEKNEAVTYKEWERRDK